MTDSERPPRSGEQYLISCGDYQAVISQQGAALRRLDWRGQELIVPFDPNKPVPTCHGQLLIPFPNRVEDGEYTFEGRHYELPLDEHERRNAIHGYGYRYPWKLEEKTPSRVKLSWRTPNMAGYPFDLTVTALYEVTADGLSVTVAAHNYGDINAPWACAIHPWLANGKHKVGDAIDADNALCRLQLPARTHVKVNDRLLPIGTESVDGTRYDLREGAKFEGQAFDDAWTDLDHAADGTVTAVFTRPDGIEVSLTGDDTITSFQVCTGSGFPEATKPAGVAVEPQTAYANAFNSGIDLIVIKPGTETRTRVQFSATTVKQ